MEYFPPDYNLYLLFVKHSLKNHPLCNTIDFQAKIWNNEKWGLYVQEKGRLIFESELSLAKTPEWITEDCIVECQYMCDEEPRWWKPIGLRVDKKHPNNRKTFYRTFVNIRENIQITEFF